MILGKVCGQIDSTINHPFYDGKRLLIIDKIRPDGSPTGSYLIAIDSVGAGVDETVIIVDEGGSARQIIGDSVAPLRSIVVGIVDQVAK
ncbi:MAG: EutN/CcmL family microcompartment protein [Calditrichota bacterium]